MSLSDWGAIGELIGGLAVIISLVYVGLQIRQSTAASRSATEQAFAKQYSDLNQMITNPAVGDIFARGLGGIEDLEVSEQVSFMAVLASISRTLESFYFQNLKGDLDSRLFNGWLTQYLDLHANPGVEEFWEIRRHQFSEDFVAFVDGKVGDRRAKKLYSK